MLAEAQRREMLATMGVDVYVLRSAPATAPAAMAGAIRIAVLCAKDDGLHPCANVLRKALSLALGCAAMRIDWIEVASIDAVEIPAAPVCLILGAEVARAVNAHEASKRSDDVLIAVADAPRLSLGDALARRALWQALKPIARYVRASHG